MSIAEKAEYLIETKNQIKEAIKGKGVEVSDTDTFRSYANKIEEIKSGGNLTDNFSTNWETSNSYNMIIQKLTKEIPNSILQEAFNNQAVIRLDQSFAYCQNLQELDLSNCNTSSVNSMQNMCAGSNNLKKIFMRNLNLNNCNAINSAFSSLKVLQEIDFSGTDTSHISTFLNFCNTCSALVRFKGILDVKSNTANIANIFGNCSNLEEVYIKNLNSSGLNLSGSPKLKKECLVFLLENAIATSSETRTINMGPSNTAKLSPEELAVGTNKGYTIS